MVTADGKPIRRIAGATALGVVVVWVLVRWWLNARLDQNGWVLPPELAVSVDPALFFQRALWAVAAVLALGGALWWLLRSRSQRVVRSTLWGLLAVWVAAWLWAAVGQWRNQVNRLNLTATQTETLRVVGVQLAKPSTRSAGGVRMFVEWPAQGGLHTVLIEDATEALLQQPTHLALTLAPGRHRGWYVLGWSVPGTGQKGQP
ncbi:MAG TPA: hypothetical protein PK347_02135 [Burkholderiaceae bacterium]|nr:hypothetical protein [Burkholderiaceae bacterium]